MPVFSSSGDNKLYRFIKRTMIALGFAASGFATGYSLEHFHHNHGKNSQETVIIQAPKKDPVYEPDTDDQRDLKLGSAPRDKINIIDTNYLKMFQRGDTLFIKTSGKVKIN